MVVIDEDGDITGTKGEILEVYEKLSVASDAKGPQGETNYYPDVIYNKSNYIYWMDHNSSGTNWGSTASGTSFTAVDTPTQTSLVAGSDGNAASIGELKTAYEKFEDGDTVDIGLIIAGLVVLFFSFFLFVPVNTWPPFF